MKQIKTPTLNDIARQLEALQNSIDELQQENKALKRGQDRVELAISQPDAVQNLKDEVAAQNDAAIRDLVQEMKTR
jgi:predicted nuclease with TOPRIM domain